MTPKSPLTSLVLFAAFLAFGLSARAADVILPKPEAPFSGKVGPTYKESTPDYPKPPAAPKGAPNVLLILTDDTGFLNQTGETPKPSSACRGLAIA